MFWTHYVKFLTLATNNVMICNILSFGTLRYIAFSMCQLHWNVGKRNRYLYHSHMHRTLVFFFDSANNIINCNEYAHLDAHCNALRQSTGLKYLFLLEQRSFANYATATAFFYQYCYLHLHKWRWESVWNVMLMPIVLMHIGTIIVVIAQQAISHEFHFLWSINVELICCLLHRHTLPPRKYNTLIKCCIPFFLIKEISDTKPEGNWEWKAQC